MRLLGGEAVAQRGQVLVCCRPDPRVGAGVGCPWWRGEPGGNER